MSEIKKKEVVKSRFERAEELAGRHSLGELVVMVPLMRDVRHKGILSLLAIPTLLKFGGTVFPDYEYMHSIPTWVAILVGLFVMAMFGFLSIFSVYIFTGCMIAVDEFMTGTLALQLKKKEKEMGHE